MTLPTTIINLLRECGITTLEQRVIKGCVRRLGSDPAHLTAIEVMERGTTVSGLTLLMTLHPGNEPRARTSGMLMAAILDLVTPNWKARQGWLTDQLKMFARERAKLLKQGQVGISKVTYQNTVVTMTFNPALNRVDFRVVIKPAKGALRGSPALAA